MSKRKRRKYRHRRLPQGTNRHHRLPKSRGGRDSGQNISVVPVNQHQAWHTMFANMQAWEIADKINRVWLDPEYELVLVRRGEMEHQPELPLDERYRLAEQHQLDLPEPPQPKKSDDYPFICPAYCAVCPFCDRT